MDTKSGVRRLLAGTVAVSVSGLLAGEARAQNVYQTESRFKLVADALLRQEWTRELFADALGSMEQPRVVHLLLLERGSERLDGVVLRLDVGQRHGRPCSTPGQGGRSTRVTTLEVPLRSERS